MSAFGSHRMMVGGSLAPFHPYHPVPNSPCVVPAVGDCCNLHGDHGCDLHGDHGYQDHGYDLHGDHGWQRGSSCCVPGLVRLPGAVAWNTAEMDPRKRQIFETSAILVFCCMLLEFFQIFFAEDPKPCVALAPMAGLEASHATVTWCCCRNISTALLPANRSGER